MIIIFFTFQITKKYITDCQDLEETKDGNPNYFSSLSLAVSSLSEVRRLTYLYDMMGDGVITAMEVIKDPRYM